MAGRKKQRSHKLKTPSILKSEDSFGESLAALPEKRPRPNTSYVESDFNEEIYESDPQGQTSQIPEASQGELEMELDGLKEEAEDYETAQAHTDSLVQETMGNIGRRTRGGKKAKSQDTDDEEYVEEDAGAGSDDFDDPSAEDDLAGSPSSRRGRIDSFIAKDDAEDDEDSWSEEAAAPKRGRKRKGRKSGSQKRGKRSRRSGKSKSNILMSSDEEGSSEPDRTLTLEEELDDLQSSDAPPTPPLESDSEPTRKLHLRARKEINYEIPPPPAPGDPIAEEPASPRPPPTPRRGRGAAGGFATGNTAVRRLFPTMGPFGGSDVTSVFGNNQPPAIDDDSDEEPIVGTVVSGPSGATGGVAAVGPGVPTGKKATLADSDPLGVDMNVDFSAVGGLDGYIDQLKEMVALPLLYPEVYQRFNITPPRGVLFHGPPGTGKTLMARALAASCSSPSRKITFFMRKGADCLSKWVGEAERQLRLLFEEAKAQQPSIIFFDEIDGLAPVRSSKQEQIHASIVSTLLALMDGMDNRGQVIVVGATNRPDSVDPALRRPGRFDREMYFPLPNQEARRQILGIHTRKWDPPVPGEVLDRLAGLTKGYGGADLRALCTEAALHAIQRTYPQIYESDQKLAVVPENVKVLPGDFFVAAEKIVPSSARSVSSAAAPLPKSIAPLLQETVKKLQEQVARVVAYTGKAKTAANRTISDVVDEMGDWETQESRKELQAARIFRPRLLIAGQAGLGQEFVGPALLHGLDGMTVQTLDLASVFGDATRTPEAAIIQLMAEARRQKPSIIYIPNVDVWHRSLPESARATFAGLLQTILPSERILVVAVSNMEMEDLSPELVAQFGYSSENCFRLERPSEAQRLEFFEAGLGKAVRMKPEVPADKRKKRRTLPKLPVVAAPVIEERKLSEAELKAQKKRDMQLKNLLKVKLSGIMELFSKRYRKFKKPIIDDYHLVHLFEPEDPNRPPAAYVMDDTGTMILEVATGKKFHNMDLDVVEERLWNGFYSEPKQYLRDIELIYADSKESGDRERILKASEMYANAQVLIDEVATVDPSFVAECHRMRIREREEQQKLKNEQEKAALEAEAETVNDTDSKQNGDHVLLPAQTVTNTLLNGNDEKPDAEAEEAEAEAEADGGDGDISMVDVNGGANWNGETVHDSPTDVTEEISAVNDKEFTGTAEGDNSANSSGQPEEKSESEEAEEPMEEPVEESEEESEPEADLHPPFELSESKLQKFLQHLVEKTADSSIEKLQIISAKLIDVAFTDGKDMWNRNELIDLLHDEFIRILLRLDPTI